MISMHPRAPVLTVVDAAPRTEAGSTATGFKAETILDHTALLTLAQSLPQGATPFQAAPWIKAHHAHLTPSRGARSLAIKVTSNGSGQLALVLPLTVQREGGLSVATFPDFGVSDYGGPILGPASPTESHDAGAMWTEICRALPGVDLIRLTSMPGTIGGRPNPLASLSGTTRARHSGHSVTVPGTVEEFLVSRGKKYRKEAERCYRLLEKEGPWTFARAGSAAEITKAFGMLESQQRARRAERGGSYALDQKAYSDFYHALAHDGIETGFTRLYTLRSGGEPVAGLFGIVHQNTFVLLRISTAGAAWQRLSPGRLIVLEAMRALTAEGIRTFDMGIGDYAFKDGFGADTHPLTDLTVPLTLKAHPSVLMSRAKGYARQSPLFNRLARAIRRRT